MSTKRAENTYVLVEQFMNGTVTCSINTSLVTGVTFEEARQKVRRLKYVVVALDDDKRISGHVEQPEDNILDVSFRMDNEHPKVF